MKVSMKADYGLRALLDLAERHGEGPTPCHGIAARQDIPAPFLDQLLMTLRRAGLVRSTRGPRGGHVLARPPEEITVATALAVLDGGTEVAVAEVEISAYAPAVRVVLERAELAARQVLESITLADLVHEQRGHPVFHGIYKPEVAVH